jgi:hypothetical protein
MKYFVERVLNKTFIICATRYGIVIYLWVEEATFL